MDQDKETSKLAIIGNVDAGKSTLVGVLTKGILDDASGGAREVIFLFLTLFFLIESLQL